MRNKKNEELMATDKLLVHFLRQNKTILLLLIFLPFVFAYSAAISNIQVLKTPEDLQRYIEQSATSPVTLGMLGPILSATMAGVTAWRIRLSSGLFAAIFSIIAVIKSTRKEEELGRYELLGACAVGRKAPLAAPLIGTFLSNLLGGLLMAAGYIGAGFPPLGSLAAGLATALCGCFFAALAGVCAQVTASARSANSISFTLLGFFIFFNVAGNFQRYPNGVFYLSPFNWGTMIRPFAGERFEIVFIPILLIILVVTGAYVLLAKRDMGAGLIAEKRGRAAAKPAFNNPFALSWRLQRGSLFGWTAAYAILGVILGSLIVTIDSMLQGSALADWMIKLGGSGKAFISFIIYIMAQVVSVYAVIAILHLRTEEVEMRGEPILSTSVSRIKWAAGHLLFSFAGAAVIIAALGMGCGIAASVVMRDSGEVISIFMSSIAKIPAVWVVASIAVFLFGWRPSLTGAVSWTFIGIFIAIEFLWELHVLGNQVFLLSPFSYVYPTNTVTLGTTAALILIAMALTTAGSVGIQHREIGR